MRGNLYSYVACVYHEPGTDFGIGFPDLPGVFVAGGTLEETKGYAQQSLRLHLLYLLEEGLDFPSSTAKIDIPGDTYVVEVTL